MPLARGSGSSGYLPSLVGMPRRDEHCWSSWSANQNVAQAALGGDMIPRISRLARGRMAETLLVGPCFSELPNSKPDRSGGGTGGNKLDLKSLTVPKTQSSLEKKDPGHDFQLRGSVPHPSTMDVFSAGAILTLAPSSDDLKGHIMMWGDNTESATMDNVTEESGAGLDLLGKPGVSVSGRGASFNQNLGVPYQYCSRKLEDIPQVSGGAGHAALGLGFLDIRDMRMGAALDSLARWIPQGSSDVSESRVPTDTLMTSAWTTGTLDIEGVSVVGIGGAPHFGLNTWSVLNQAEIPVDATAHPQEMMDYLITSPPGKDDTDETREGPLAPKTSKSCNKDIRDLVDGVGMPKVLDDSPDTGS
ncbi:hypothetical protein NDU88_006450 [Pleurodeles waltl]|uniref:Uncharacterized protein n=1 Tax=Pleurodeles waltl TaxID=8319 RepID=A0AAV7RQ52_PLEWA|nr:hypothetical protein NDU88_006450 [Pleurodeles waltl]